MLQRWTNGRNKQHSHHPRRFCLWLVSNSAHHRASISLQRLLGLRFVFWLLQQRSSQPHDGKDRQVSKRSTASEYGQLACTTSNWKRESISASSSNNRPWKSKANNKVSHSVTSLWYYVEVLMLMSHINYTRKSKMPRRENIMIVHSTSSDFL